MTMIEKELDTNGILILRLNRPEKLNALNGELIKELTEILTYAKVDTKVKALLLTGAGKAFCAGADISRLADCNAEKGYQFATQGQNVFRQLEDLGKPSLAAVNGFAFGGGCELALAATLRVAVTTAQFGLPEVKLGVIPGYGGTQRLARLIGKGRALELCLTGRFIDASTALNWGLVNEVVEPDNLLDRAEQILLTIINQAPLAVASIMAVIDYGYNLSLTEALHLEATHFAKVCGSADKQEGVEAFLAKRKPVFTGA